MSTAVKTEAEKRAKLYKIIRGIPAALMVTHNADGGMHGRPMATAEVEENMVRLWFATSVQSVKVAELAADDRVLCAYGSAAGGEWATVNGHVRTVNDRSKIRDLWSPFWKNWFTGPDDPSIILLEVIPDSAEYWDSGNMVLSAVKLAIAAVTGRHVNEGENQKLSLQ